MRRKWTHAFRLSARLVAATAMMAGVLADFSGPARADTSTLTLVKSATATSVAPGTSFDYLLKYSCSSLTTTCDGVTITDRLPDELSHLAADVTLTGDGNTTATSYNPASGTATFTMVSPMPAGTTGVVAITVKFPAGTTPVGAKAVNAATIDADNAAEVTSNEVDVEATVSPSMTIAKNLSTSPFVLNSPITYTLPWTNNGTVGLSNPTLVDTVPTGAIINSCGGGASCTIDHTANTVTWSLATAGPVALPGQSNPGPTVTVTYPSPPFTAGAPITNTVVASATPLGTDVPITRTASITNTPEGANPGISATKIQTSPSSSNSVQLGRLITYTLTVRNTGNEGLKTVSMTDTLPDGTTFVSCTNVSSSTCSNSAGVVTWTFPNNLAAAGGFTVTVTVRYTSPPFNAGDVVTDKLDVAGTPLSGGTPVTDTTTLGTTLLASGPGPGIAVTKNLNTAAGFVVDVPQQYGVVLTNNGATPLSNIVVTDPLPTSPSGAPSTFLSCGPAAPVTCSLGPDNTVTWTVPSLAIDATLTLTVNLTFPVPGFHPGDTVRNCVTGTAIAAGNLINFPSDEPACRSDILELAAATANISKTASAATLGLGQAATYTITSANTGTEPLSGFVITDTIPPNLRPNPNVATNVSYTDVRQPVNAAGNTLQWFNPDTSAWVTVTTKTCTGGTPAGSLCTASIPTNASAVRVLYSRGGAPSIPAPSMPADLNAGSSQTITLNLQVPPDGLDRNGAAINEGDSITNCAETTADDLATSPRACSNQTVREPAPTMTLAKGRTSPGTVTPTSTVTWTLAFGTSSTSFSPTINPVVTDCLPATLELVNPDNPSDPANGSPPASFTPPDPSITTAPGSTANGCAAGTTAVVWSWAGSSPALRIAPGTTGTFTLNTVVKPGTAPGTITNTARAVAENNPTAVTSTFTVAVATGASLDSLKLVKGSLDSSFSKLGHTTIGGTADYQLTITNTGNVPIKNVSVVDILPFVGDTAVLNAEPRNSDWEPILVGAVSAPGGVSVQYSTSTNPCRTDLVPSGPAGCDAGTFSTGVPSPISSVRSLQFTFAGPLAPAQTLTLTWPMTTPVNAPINGTAWNSFAFTGFRTDNGDQLTPAEPNKVGFLVDPYPLQIKKLVNGSPEPDAPGLFIPVGDPVTYTYLITNPGDLSVNALHLTDDPGQTIACGDPPVPITPDTTIPPHSTLTCSSDAGPALTGVHADTATVTGQPLVGGEPAGDRTASVHATAHYNGVTRALTVEKLVNGHHEPHAPGVLVPVGSTITFTYKVTNTGDVTLNPVTLSDVPLGDIDCPATALAPGDSMTCRKTATAQEGQHSDTVTATGQGVNDAGDPVLPPVTATDTGNYEAITPRVDTVVTDAANGDHWNNSQIVGARAIDTATVSGAAGRPNPTGTVIYHFFHNDSCHGTPETSETVTLADGNVPDSSPTAALAAGSYSFVAVYSGDANFAGATSDCERFSVDKAAPDAATAVHDHATGNEWANTEVTGSRAFDRITLTNLVDGFHPTGTVTYRFFTNGSCDGTPDTHEAVDLTDGHVPDSGPTAALAAGDYSFQAIYSGDDNYLGATSPCEIFRVEPKILPLTTRVFDHATGNAWTNGEPAGSRAFDRATLHGVVSGIVPTGTVTYSFFHTGHCTGEAATTEDVHLTDGTVPDSAPTEPLETGHFSFRAVYSGDSNYATFTSRCEPFSAGKATPSISTDPSAGDVVGTAIYDTATINGGSNPTGDVTFKLFGLGDDTCAGTPIFTDTIGLNGGLVARSGNFTPAAAGTYRWIATYNGDANNAIVSSGCDEEPVTMGRATPDEITTQPLPVAGPIGTIIADTATVTGGHNPTGTITFKLFPPGDHTCTGTPVFTSDSHLAGDPPSASSEAFTTTEVGTYRWIATYNGDANNEPKSSDCADEPVDITKANPNIATSPRPAAGPVGIAIRDLARVTGGHNPTGSVTFKLFPPGDDTCSGTPVFTDTRDLHGNPARARSGLFTTTQVGTYHWVATYSGDDHNNIAFTGCTDEPVVIRRGTPTIETRTTPPGPDATVAAGRPIFDTATVSGGSSPTGDVVFKLFGPGDDTCTGSPVFTDTRPLGTEPPLIVDSGHFTPSMPGTYRWVATYEGDTNNDPVSSDCADEPVQVIRAVPDIGTEVSPGGVVGTTISDTAHVTGGFNPSGDVTFKLFPAADTTCTGTPVFTSTNPLTDGRATSDDFRTTAAGRFEWVATYNGDTSNEPVSSGCGDEPVEIVKATPDIGTEVSPGGVLGVSITDSAHVTGGFSPSGSVRFDLFPPEDTTCTGTPVFTSTNALTAGSATSDSFTPDAPGIYHWVATYTGDDNNHEVSSGCTDEPVEIIARAPAISIVKDADTQIFSEAGTLITYKYTITNIGNVPLRDVKVTDSRLGPVPGCSVRLLEPQQVHECTATRRTTTADLDRGHITNTATAAGTGPDGNEVTQKSNKVRIKAEQKPEIGIVKSASVGSFSQAGTAITYFYDVVNSGNVTLHNIIVSDSQLGTITCPQTYLAAGASMRCEATGQTTQAQVDAGFIADIVKVTGISPKGQEVNDSDELTIKAEHHPAISIAKSASIASFSRPGTPVTYFYTVTNTGNITLTGIDVSDSLGIHVDCPLTSLVPGQQMQCAASARTTRADVRRGRVTDTATVTTSSPQARAEASLTIPLERVPAISITKTASKLAFSKAGTVITYFYTITNTGNVKVSGITVTDSRLGIITCPKTALAPGQRMMCKARHVISAADVRLGKVINTVTVAGHQKNLNQVIARAALAILKSAIPGPVVPPVTPRVIPITG